MEEELKEENNIRKTELKQREREIALSEKRYEDERKEKKREAETARDKKLSEITNETILHLLTGLMRTLDKWDSV